jgi:hypothetical protein
LTLIDAVCSEGESEEGLRPDSEVKLAEVQKSRFGEGKEEEGESAAAEQSGK